MDKRNEEWTKTYKKVKGVFEELDELVLQVLSAQEKQTTPDRFKEPLTINIFHTVSAGQEQSTTELNGQFVHSQLLIDCLVRMRSASTDKNEFISYCKKEYATENSKLKDISDFQQEYSSDHALTWYTKTCFLFELLNKALRVQDIDLLYLFGFFIRDLHEQLKQNQHATLIHVYRGQFMSKKEVQQLENSIGQLISMNSFFSTTLSRRVADMFLDNTGASNGDFQSVLFEIEADPQIVGVKSFANITPFSDFTDEEEVLMMLGSIFWLVHIRYEDQVCVIQLVLRSENGHDVKPIFDQMKIDYHNKGHTSGAVFSIVLANMGKFDDAERYLRRSLNETPPAHRTEQMNAYNLSVSYINLGTIATRKGDYNRGLEWFNKSLTITLQISQSDDPRIAHIHNAIAAAYYHKGEYKRAIDSYNKELTINIRKFGEDHSKVAQCLSNIGGVYTKEEKYSEALHYQHKALIIQQKYLPANDYFLGVSHTNLAVSYRGLRQFDLALKHCNMALTIFEKSLPAQHPDIPITYNCMATIYTDMGNYQQALFYLEKAAAIYRQPVSLNHPNAAAIEGNILNIRHLLRRDT